MIPIRLLRGTPISFEDVQAGDVIDTYSPDMGERSRFHCRKGQVVTQAPGGGCDLYTDYDMICRNLGLHIQLVYRPLSQEEQG